ncbi:MAG: hypothetical protein F6K56_38510 [Moorea sp. SIO3G5]|nr:hypothetical protein [Moorena sp. SIO3G5]
MQRGLGGLPHELTASRQENSAIQLTKNFEYGLFPLLPTPYSLLPKTQRFVVPHEYKNCYRISPLSRFKPIRLISI